MVCNEAIAKGEARLAEEYSDVGIPKLIMRFYHLKCAAAAQPELLHHALQSDIRLGATFDRDEIEAKIAPAIEREKQKRIANYQAKLAAAPKPALATDATTLAVLEQLEADPEDADTLAIVADQLTLRGDPRGELITVQLSLAKIDRRPKLRPTGDDDEDDDDEEADAEAEENEEMAKALARRYEELMMQLALPSLDKNDRAIWGTGFVKRLELVGKSATRLGELEAIWRHPTLHVLAELKLGFQSATDSFTMAALAQVVRPSIRRLELGDHPEWALDNVHDLLAALPRLRSLVLVGRPRMAIAHATLESLKLSRGARVGDLPAALQHVTAANLPALRELVLEGFDHTQELYDWSNINRPRVTETKRTADMLDSVVMTLGANGLLAQLTHLTITGGILTDSGIKFLAKALGGRELAKLDLTGTPLPKPARAQLQELCGELGFTDATPRGDGEVEVEHANQPSWGKGKIVRRFEGKLEIEFPKPIGKKVFKADAAFLRFG
jgi:hypothetical protein